MNIVPQSHSIAFEVAFCNINATRKCYSAVYNDDFAVVAVVQIVGQVGEGDGRETTYLNATRTQARDELLAQLPTTHRIENQTHLDTLASLLFEQLGDVVTHLVLAKDVVLDMD